MISKTCSKCRKRKSAKEFSPRPERPIGLSPSCKACKAKRRSDRYFRRRKEEPEVLWVQNAYSWAKDRARRASVPFALSRDDVSNALRETKGHCEYCEVPLNFRRTTATRKDSPTIDRIVPRLGYTVRNVVICCYRCNMTKNDATAAELRNLSAKVTSLVLGRGLPET